MKGSPSRQDVMQAMATFDRDGLPDDFQSSVYYFLVHPDTGFTYPPKAIWGLATGYGPYDFNAQSAKRWLENLGFYVHDNRKQVGQDDFNQAVQDAMSDSPVTRQKRLEASSDVATSTVQLVRRFRRNPDVVAERLSRADGHCENCGNPAPFKRASNGSPFLEVHHIIPLADDGPDTVENTLALCPNCHRKAHFG